MEIFKTEQIRNITLMGNAGSGKTTLAEAMLFEGGQIKRKGEVTSKNTVSDHNYIEQEYGNSVMSTPLFTTYSNNKINILDTPGMDDLSGSVVSSLNVTDLAVMVINSTN